MRKRLEKKKMARIARRERERREREGEEKKANTIMALSLTDALICITEKRPHSFFLFFFCHSSGIYFLAAVKYFRLFSTRLSFSGSFSH